MTDSNTILVTGATGNVGRHLVTQLVDSGVHVRALSRDPSSARLPETVDVVRGDTAVAGDLDAALDGVDTVFLLWPLVSSEGAQPVVDMIAKRPRRIVYLSASGVDDAKDPGDNGVWGQIEDMIEQSGLEWTFLRAGGFATNTLAWAEQIRTAGRVQMPFGGAARSLVHERDLADVAALALTRDGHTGQKYVLTGPETVTQIDQVRIIGEESGQAVGWEDRDVDAARADFARELGDQDFADAAFQYWATLVDNPETVTDTVPHLTGRPARSFRTWAADHADAFVQRPAESTD